MLKKYNDIYFILGLFALLIGFTGQFLLGQNQPFPAAILYVLAVILIVFALHRQAGPQVELSAFQPIESGDNILWGYAFGGLAIILTGAAFFLFASGPAILPWSLHLVSVGLLVVSVYLLDGKKQQSDSQNPWSYLEIGIFILIFVIAAFMRLYRFDQIPFGTWFDEADEGLNALQIMNQPGYLPIFAGSTLQPAHYIYLIVLSFKIFGVSTLSIRAVNVVFGLATVAVAYFTGRELFNRKIGLVLAFFVAVSRWDINWSRLGMHGITVPFFELLICGLLLRALRRQRLMDYALAGLSIGFSICFYPPLRFFPVVIALFLAMVWINRHDFFRSSWRGLIIFCLGGIVAAIPILHLMTFQSEVFWSRMQSVSIFTGKTPEEGWQAASQTTRDHLLMFNYRGDRNGRHNLPGKPMVDAVSGTLLVLGLALSLWRIRQPGSFLILTWLLLMLIPGIFSLDFESPQSLRAIGSLPAAFLLASVPIHSFWQEWEKIAKNRSNLFFIAPLALILGIAGFINFNVYFNQQARSGDSWSSFSTPETRVGNIMNELGNSVEYYVSTFYAGTPTIIFLAPQVTDYHRLETYHTFPIPLEGDKGAVFLVDSDRKPFVLQAKKYYPSATFKEFKSPDGTTVLYEIYLSPADIQASQGLTASYYHDADFSGQPFLVRQEKNVNFDWQDGEPASFPFYVEWKGILFARTYGEYMITTHSPSPIELVIDEVPIAFHGGGQTQTADVLLAKGTHTVRIRTKGMAGHYELDWLPPSETEVPIPPSAFLLSPFTNNGLLGQYYADPEWGGTPAFTQIDPWVYFYFHNTPLERPYTIEWSGSIDIPSSGEYFFGLESIDESSLWIDDQQILDVRTLAEYQETAINLSSGLHTIRVRYADRTGYTHINLYWTPPGAEREIIPQNVFFPPQGNPDLLNPNIGK